MQILHWFYLIFSWVLSVHNWFMKHRFFLSFVSDNSHKTVEFSSIFYNNGGMEFLCHVFYCFFRDTRISASGFLFIFCSQQASGLNINKFLKSTSNFFKQFLKNQYKNAFHHFYYSVIHNRLFVLMSCLTQKTVFRPDSIHFLLYVLSDLRK